MNEIYQHYELWKLCNLLCQYSGKLDFTSDTMWTASIEDHSYRGWSFEAKDWINAYEHLYMMVTKK